MTEQVVSPFNQKIRINLLRVAALLVLPVAAIVHPVWSDGVVTETFEQVGIFLIMAGIAGRFWSILYIGGHKNFAVIDDGPYSICRHPLYLFSGIAVLGFGIMLQSLVFAVGLTALFVAVMSWTAAKEEAFLRHSFGPAYDDYAARTPRIVPALHRFRAGPERAFSLSALRRNLADALVLALLVPLAELVEALRGPLHAAMGVVTLALW